MRLEGFLAARQLFPPELLALADRAERERGLPSSDAERFLALAVSAFELSAEPVDRAWYGELERVSSVAADIGGVRSTHINHLTPRVLDIDELYGRMSDRGIEMIDAIQGPPRWAGPDVLLRQTSFRALAECRRLREPDGTVVEGALRVRFGEVEARGITLSVAGRVRYEELLARIEDGVRNEPGRDRADIARAVWSAGFPASERCFHDQGLALFTYRRCENAPTGQPPGTLSALIDQGWVRAEPIVYEDFLPRSAAGIFQSNLTGAGIRDHRQQSPRYDLGYLADVLDREVHDPFTLYERQRDASLADIAAQLGRAGLRSVRLIP
jgi:uncharacterized glyoxalase superfamily metalloenzyme YdcJ